MSATLFQRSSEGEHNVPGTWRLIDRGGEKPMVQVVCPGCGGYGLLSDHKVISDGTVSPSMDCREEGCEYHTWIKLDNWDLGELDNQGEAKTMTGLGSVREQKKEWDLWQNLGTVLRDTGAVTEKDWKTPQGDRDTAGQRLLAVIRAWGDSLVELRGVRAPMPDPVMMGLATQLVPAAATLIPNRTEVNDEAIVRRAKSLAEEILKQCIHRP